jgi:hypothetical protein
MFVDPNDSEIKGYIDTYVHITAGEGKDDFFLEEWNRLQELITLMTHQLYALKTVTRRQGKPLLLPEPPDYVPARAEDSGNNLKNPMKAKEEIEFVT